MITNGNNSVWIIKVLLSFYTAESLLLKELTHSEGRKLAGTAFVRIVLFFLKRKELRLRPTF